MVGKIDYSSVPTSLDLENNSSQKKYTVNQNNSKGLVISKPLCTLMAIGALLLAVLAGLVVFFLVPRGCSGTGEGPMASLMKKEGESSIMMDNLLDEVNERLPRSIKPLHYRIEIRPDFGNGTTQGTETITFQPAEDTDTITFHANKIDIDSQSLDIRSSDGQNGDSLPIRSHDYLEGQRYRIVVDQKLKKDKTYSLNLRYQGELNNQLQGFYKSHYQSPSGETRIAASTQFSPTDARRAFPCFDEPYFKAKFNIRLARPGNMSTLSNMPLERSEILPTVEGAWYWDNYPETPEMPTYLVAFVMSDLISMQSSDRNIKVWARKEYLSQTNYAANIAPTILRYFEDYFSIRFPLPKIDIVALPEFGFGAMENWGLITFRESNLLFDNYGSTVEDRRTIATVLSHEIAHQWFGNLVTPKWWNDLWLKEGFATYLMYLGVDHAEPSWKIMEEFIPSEIQRAMSVDRLEYSRPISYEFINSRQIKQAFDDISYAKGASIIRMMNHFLGEDTFKTGLIKYLEKFKFGNADRDDLFDSLTEEAHRSGALLPNETVNEIMSTWTEQAGFPVINVVPDYVKNTLKLVQKRFLLNNPKPSDDTRWWIPISYTSSSLTQNNLDTKPKIWLRGEKEVVVQVDPIGDWYLLNLNYTGYYLVNYDEKNWKRLSERIMAVPALARAQLITDAMDLARASQLDYEIPLRMIARMAVQDEQIMFIPTAVAFDKLSFLSDILYDTPAFGLFEEYHKAIFKRTYQLVDFNDDIDDYITRRIRQMVLTWSCRSAESRCVHESRARFRSWMINGKTSRNRNATANTIVPNLRSIIYCTAIREGSELEWNFAYEKYLESTSPSEKNVLLDALGCTKLKWLLSRYLDKLIDGYSIRIQDADRVFESVANNKEGMLIAFDFIRKNWNELLNHYGDGFNILGKMINSLASHMTTEFQLDELIRFRESIKANISTATQSFDIAIKTVKANVDWMSKNYQQVEDWLTKHQEQFHYL
ncbi:aminopeptidase N-like isoform X1 [Sitophilus oryzae]|uniref:Aminopeptidase n=1 Tax=Sitophilus oryzae TaxID=7048 RepID=A0A6J2Y7E0_SITOR|nr:aminopeptidase N-like isoform X1 [Sitophilus oryzae]XP_030759011.1 aminopeptidase N-like isoform X1 [Sitophilus oryzae]XP_030759014.1 aminopeptidase N-like isoform X1 [Sitophilus oryzae]